MEFPSHSTGPPGGSGKSGHLQLELCRGKRAQLTTTGHGTSHRQWTRGRPAYLSAVAHEISTICLCASRCAALCLSLVARSTHHLRSNTPQTTHLPVGEPGVHVSRRRDSLQTSASASRLASPFYRRGPPPTATGLDNNRIAELSNPASLRSGRVRRRSSTSRTGNWRSESLDATIFAARSRRHAQPRRRRRNSRPACSFSTTWSAGSPCTPPISAEICTSW